MRYSMPTTGPMRPKVHASMILMAFRVYIYSSTIFLIPDVLEP